MCKRLNQCKDAQDFIRYANHKRTEIGETVSVVACSNGVKVYGPIKPNYALIHSNHPRELATGTRMAIVKALISIGLGMIGLATYILPALAKAF